jgi:hypothetical protein
MFIFISILINNYPLLIIKGYYIISSILIIFTALIIITAASYHDL